MGCMLNYMVSIFQVTDDKYRVELLIIELLDENLLVGGNIGSLESSLIPGDIRPGRAPVSAGDNG